MSGVIYCIKDSISINDVKQLIHSHINKMGIKLLTPKLSSALSDDQQSLKSKSLEIDKIFQDCSELLKEISHEKHFKNQEDDDVLLVCDNFHSIATKELALHTRVYVHKSRDDWHEGVISEITNTNSAIAERTYWVRFGKGRSFPFTSKKIAFSDIPSDKLSIGTRVIGLHKGGGNIAWHLGVVSEPPNLKNQNRYLIFFDDGYAQYNSCTDVRQVYDQNKCVWEDIIGDTAFVIRDYIQQYPNRSMVRLKPGHSIKVNFKGDWVCATVLEVDASLVKMMHVGSKVEEWIYRGSRRLEPLYNELSKAEASQKLGRAPRFRTDPKLQKKGAYVVYIMQSDENDPNKDVELIDLDPKLSPGVKRPVARKSCHNQNVIANHSETQIPQKPEPDGVLQGIDRSRIPQSNSALKKNKKTCVKCTPKCVMEGGDDPSKFRGSNPLLTPMLYGWERKLTKAHGRKKTVSYTAFCGKVLKNIDDLDQCLMTSNSQLTIDLFSFDINLNTDHEFVVKKNFCDIKDFSLGKEKIPIPCINSVDRRFPEYIEYSTHRIPGEGVNLNTKPEFLVGCNCTDNCRDRTKCQCIRLTVDATDCIPNGRNPKAGYTHRRLKQPIVTGLYECNSNCSCDHRCQNRVIQNGLNLRLQIFKTEQKGWGLRSMDDIPAGGFICVYSGQILTEESANEDGQLYGDEYLADLDHIDVVEKEKEGYESDVRMDDEDDDDDNSDDDHHDDDDDNEDNNGEEDDDDLKWLKHYHYKSVEKKPMVKRISKKTSQSKPVARKFTSKKTSSQSWPTKSKVKESKQQKNEQRCEGRGGNESTKPDSISPKERNDKASNSGESSMSGERTKIKEERSSNGRSEVDDDMEIEIDDDDDILETNDIEQPPSSTDEQSNPRWDGLKVGKVENMEVNETIEKISDRLSVCLNKKMQNVEMMTNIQKCVYDSNRVENTYSQRKDKTIPRKTTRQLYGEDTVYIIDAKSIGNIGRYFNHSCSPNIFVQNVFYDTHDLRFPWVAFFASKLIKAGTELTWNYNYEVGSVPGKKLACHCGSANCNGRLL